MSAISIVSKGVIVSPIGDIANRGLDSRHCSSGRVSWEQTARDLAKPVAGPGLSRLPADRQQTDNRWGLIRRIAAQIDPRRRSVIGLDANKQMTVVFRSPAAACAALSLVASPAASRCSRRCCCRWRRASRRHGGAITAHSPPSPPIGPAPIRSRPASPIIEFIASDGTRLPLRKWLPRGPVKAAILALHGFNDYSHAFEIPGKGLGGARHRDLCLRPARVRRRSGSRLLGRRGASGGRCDHRDPPLAPHLSRTPGLSARRKHGRRGRDPRGDRDDEGGHRPDPRACRGPRPMG